LDISYTINDIDNVAKQLLENVSAKTLLFYGDMGVGKTTLIKAIVKALGSQDIVTSPTFAIINQYQSQEDPIYHFDFYRINDIEEAYNFGVEDYLYSNYWCIIEWPERIQSILPKYADRIDLVLNPDNSRTLKLNCKTNLTEKYMFKRK
jgi:tRNA threonylcarbamoyladenosine biosynthesis protein TsaE